jgi:hypothetical protein
MGLPEGFQAKNKSVSVVCFGGIEKYFSTLGGWAGKIVSNFF